MKGDGFKVLCNNDKTKELNPSKYKNGEVILNLLANSRYIGKPGNIFCRKVFNISKAVKQAKIKLNWQGRKMKLALILLFLSCCTFATEIFQMTVKKIPEPNLLKNAVFTIANNQKVPDQWFFKDFSQKPKFTYETNHGIFHLETTGGLYGYLIQAQVPVREGEKYYAEVKVKLNSRALLWITTTQYDDKLGAFQEPKSSTTIYSIANPDQGERLVAELRYFINPDYLLPISSTQWNRCASEFTVPQNHGITNYEFRIGAYGGKIGWLEIKDPVFSLSRQKLQLTLTGKNLVKLKIYHSDGSVINTFNLDPEQNENQADVTLNSRMIRYFVEITDRTGTTQRRFL
ncbi:MAG: hypothetical protein WCV67_01195 [Victivallaceae bacterium]